MAISLDEMTGLARALLEAEVAEEKAEAALKVATETTRRLREDTIPCAMQELGLTKLQLTTGQTLEIKNEVYASIPAQHREAAFAWLDVNGFGGLIKTEVSIAWDRGNLKKAIQFFKHVLRTVPQAELVQTVHPQTLKAFVREQLTKAASVPMELFGARSVDTAKISKG